VGRKVLKPLGMGSTVLTQGVTRGARRARRTRRSTAHSAHSPEDDEVFAPAGGVSSTIADMVPYLRMQLNDGALAGVRVASAERSTPRTPRPRGGAERRGLHGSALWLDGRVQRLIGESKATHPSGRRWLRTTTPPIIGEWSRACSPFPRVQSPCLTDHG